jgi:hypothetical protein
LTLKVQEQDTQHNTQQERTQPTNPDSYVHRKNFCINNISNVVTCVESAVEYKDIALGVFLDIEGGFDRTSFDVIKQAAERHGVEPTICRWTCAILESRNIIAALSGQTLGVAMARGCPQGGVLSPLLCSLVIDDLLWGCNSSTYYTVAYADDIAILINGKFFRTVSEVLQLWAQSNSGVKQQIYFY